MSFGYCRVACIPLRRHPDLCSEMISQVLFAETFEVIERHHHYARVRLEHDGYLGWLDERQTAPLEEEDFRWLHSLPTMAFVQDPVCAAGLGSRCLTLVRGTPLPGYGQGRFALPGEVGWVRGAVTQGQAFDEEMFLRSLESFLHAPYLWGGRTPLGIDCSGLVQMAYRPFGIFLPRDSHQQRHEGEPVASLEAARPGDLAFFASGIDGSSHVGIVLPASRVLHASAFVRSDPLDEEGICHQESGKRTHRLQAIRRVTSVPGEMVGKST